MREGRASETAISIAVNTVAASFDPVLRRVVADPAEPYSEWFVEAHSAKAREQLARWKSRPTSMSFWGNIMFPGGRNFIQLRKRWIDEMVREALRDGMTQVVVLGAGYDTLSLRLSAGHPGVRFFELDHPDTQAVKRRALEAHAALPGNLTLLPLDLTRESASQRLLETPGFRRGLRGVYVAEGLLMYLGPRDVDSLFRLVAQTGRPGSLFVFSMVDGRSLADARSPVRRTIQMAAFHGEPVRYGLSPRGVKAFLLRRGFRLRARADHRTLRAAYLDPLGVQLPLGEAEFLVAAESA